MNIELLNKIRKYLTKAQMYYDNEGLWLEAEQLSIELDCIQDCQKCGRSLFCGC